MKTPHLSDRHVLLGCLLTFAAGLAVEFAPSNLPELLSYITPAEMVITAGLLALCVWLWAVWGGAALVARQREEERP
jgi:hypothetical protein